MRAIVGRRELNLLIGDITLENADAIVTAANNRLIGGGGVDGAVHSKAGPGVMEQLKEKYSDGCPTGSAVLTLGGLLPSRYIIHAVGPIYKAENPDNAELLAGAYTRSLELAADHECHSIAFPAISAGAYGYPLPEAAKIGLQAIRDFESPRDLPSEIRFVLFQKDVYDHFVSAMRETEGYEIDE